MEDSKVLLLNKLQISQKLERIAFQIIENNFDEKEVIICGIKRKGFFLAKRLVAYLEKHSNFKIFLTSLSLDKKNPLNTPVEYDIPEQDLDNKVIIIIDDVANTGRTLFYSLQLFQNHLPKKIQIAVLIDRKHKTFPVRPDYIGLSLSTTMREHIHLETKGNARVYLT